jgi:putative membrane protein
MVMDFTPADHARIADAIRAAEARTSGEIVCVLARSSGEYGHVPALWSALFALAAPWPLMALTELSAQRIFLIQTAVFVALALVFSIDHFRMLLVPRAVQRARAHRAALEQFYTRGLSRTQQSNGVLIYVSLAERYARIVADDGVASKVGQEAWRKAIDALVGQIADGHLADGFVEAIDLCADVMSKIYPAEASGANHLPDHIYLV